MENTSQPEYFVRYLVSGDRSLLLSKLSRDGIFWTKGEPPEIPPVHENVVPFEESILHPVERPIYKTVREMIKSLDVKGAGEQRLYCWKHESKEFDEYGSIITSVKKAPAETITTVVEGAPPIESKIYYVEGEVKLDFARRDLTEIIKEKKIPELQRHLDSIGVKHELLKTDDKRVGIVSSSGFPTIKIHPDYTFSIKMHPGSYAPGFAANIYGPARDFPSKKIKYDAPGVATRTEDIWKVFGKFFWEEKLESEDF